MRSILNLLMSILIIGVLATAGLTMQSASAQVSLAIPEKSVEAESGSFWWGWSTPVDVSQSPTPKAIWPALDTADGQTIYLAWRDGRSAPADIYYAASSDGGRSWGTAGPVVETTGDSTRPSLVVSDTTPFVTWSDLESSVYYKVYHWTLGASAPTEVPNEHTVWASATRLVLGPGGELHLALHGGLGGNTNILYTRRDAGATTWPTATVAFTTTSSSQNPALAVSADGQTVHLVWQENLADDSEIYYLRGTRSGSDVVWEPPATSLSAGIARSVRPVIVLGTNSIHVTWGEQVGSGSAKFDTQYVRYSRWDEGGSGWSEPIRVDQNSYGANDQSPTDIEPALALTPSGALCVAWHGYRSGQDPYEDVHLSCSPDQGATWGAPVNVSRSSEAGIVSVRPTLAIGSDGILHLAWQELGHSGADPGDEYQIYYARSLPYAVLLPITRR